MGKKITCKDCKRTCCDNVSIHLCHPRRKKVLRPSTLKVGDWLYVSGITLVKKKNKLFKCRAFNSKTRLCRIWRYRPPMCREFFCSYTKRKRKRKLPLNERENVYYLYFKTCLTELRKGIYFNKKASTKSHFRHSSSETRPVA